MFLWCLCVCLSICLSVQATTFEADDIGTSFLVWWHLQTISRSHLSIKVIGSRSQWKMLILLLGHHFNLVLLVQAINKVKVKCYSHGQGLFKVNLQAGGGPATERHSYYQCRHTVPSIIMLDLIFNTLHILATFCCTLAATYIMYKKTDLYCVLICVYGTWFRYVHWSCLIFVT